MASMIFRGVLLGATIALDLTVDQAASVLLGKVPKDETVKIAAMSRDDLINLHFGLGT